MKSNLQFWTYFASRYDSFIGKHAHTTYQQIKKNIDEELTLHDTIIEVGAGTGIFTFHMAPKVKNIVATDFSQQMVDEAKKKQKITGLKNIEFLTQNVKNLDFDTHFTNKIVAINVLHLIKNPESALTELKRILQPQGWLIIAVYCHGENLKSRLYSFLMRLGGFRTANRWSLEGFNHFITASGFKIIKHKIIEDKIPLNFIVAQKK